MAMSQFKFELWEIENGIVITRPVKTGVDEDNQDVLKNSSVWREDPLTAIKEIEVALVALRARYQKLATQKR
jgi:hypothetical protein